MSKWYGSLQNRLEENQMFCDSIEVGTGVTEYQWSDRHPYEVVEVIDQKHVVVRPLDHKPCGEPMSNDWELISNPNAPTKLLEKRGKYWYWTTTVTREELDSITDKLDEMRLLMAGFEPQVIRAKGKQTKRYRANVSFGIAQYYYDYSF